MSGKNIITLIVVVVVAFGAFVFISDARQDKAHEEALARAAENVAQQQADAEANANAEQGEVVADANIASGLDEEAAEALSEADAKAQAEDAAYAAIEVDPVEDKPEVQPESESKSEPEVDPVEDEPEVQPEPESEPVSQPTSSGSNGVPAGYTGPVGPAGVVLDNNRYARAFNDPSELGEPRMPFETVFVAGEEWCHDGQQWAKMDTTPAETHYTIIEGGLAGYSVPNVVD